MKTHKLSIIINDRNQYFSHWAAKFSPQWDGDDETFVTVPEFTSFYPRAYIYKTRRAAERAAKKMWGVAVVTLEVEEDPNPPNWKYDYCQKHKCMFFSTEDHPMCPHRNNSDPRSYHPPNCVPDHETVTGIMES